MIIPSYSTLYRKRVPTIRHFIVGAVNAPTAKTTTEDRQPIASAARKIFASKGKLG